MAATKENLRRHEADYATSLVLSRRLGIGSTPVNRGAAEVIQNGQICACSIEPHRSIPRHTGRVIAGGRMSGLFRDGMGLPAMTLARLYDQHAEECARSA